MPGIMEETERKVSNISNGSKQGESRKSKSDDSASFLRAARGGNSEKVLEYLKNGIDINTCNANGLNALHLSSKEGHVHIVQDLLARGAKIDSATKKGNTALHIASLAGQEEVVKILVSHSASVNVQSQNGFTPLYMAAQENHDAVVRFLLASGASQSLATEDGFTPLAVALQQGHDKVVAVLLENDTRGKVRLPALHIAAKKDDTKAAALLLQNDHNPDVTSKSGFTPLHISAHYGNENIAAVLLQRGADVNYSAKHNITPLHVAAKWGKANMVGLLLDKGANLESRTRDGLTPLHCAARSGHENVVDMMLQRGAPISAKTKNGLAPLHMSSQGDHVDAARILLHHKAPVDEVTVDYLTALHVAAHCGHVRVAKLLLDRKADPNSRALNGFTPLHIACKKNRIKVVELLLKYGASIEATTESGLTPLHVASFMGCMNIVIFLIQHQASPDEATVRGETPLHLAARANQTDIIRILLRNGAKVDATAREQQTPLHIASRLGNVDIVVLLLQSGAKVDAVTKDLYTALHIAAKEGQEEVASILLENGASMSATTKKGFTPLHLSAKYGNLKVAKLLLAKEADVDAEGKNGVTPLHVAVHYDNTALALLMLERGASPHAAAKNGYTPLHISAKKNQLDIAKTLLEYGAKVNAESKAGFSPLHLAAQEGHADMTSLLVKSEAEVNRKAKNGLTALHLCAQEDRVEVAKLLVAAGADCDSETKAGYTPLHVAAHFGQINTVKYLLNQSVRVDVQNELGYTPLHQAAQQGHTQIVNLLLDAGSSPNHLSNSGQTALSIAQKLGYISVVETLKVVTDEVVTTTITTTVEEKYRVLAPESMQETFMSDSEDEGGEENIQDQSYKYLTTEEMKGLGDDSVQIDVTNDEKEKKDSVNRAAEASIEKKILEMERSRDYSREYNSINNDVTDNIEIPHKPPVSAGFLVSFMVDARGGAMRGCRHSGVRVIIPPRKAPMPMRITCRYLKKDKLVHPPPLNEGEALASRILELGPAKANFLGPVIIEVPHFASLRGKEREIIILRSDDGEKWREHSLEATEEAVQEVLQESFDGEDSNQLEDLNTNRITRILTTDFPQYFAIISRIRQELHYIGPDGGLVNSSVVPQVQAMFPQGALTKKIKVGLQAQPIPAELTAKLLGNRVAVSPIVTVEPRRRKFHKPITLTIPVPVAAGKGMINQYSGDTPTLRLLCSITGGTTRAQWEDVTGSTPLTFLNDCVSFTTTVSARFWLMDCRNVPEATKMATNLYKEAIHVPFMAKFVVFSKRHEQLEARMRVFCMTDDREEKTLEHQEHFHEIAKSRDVEVLEGKTHYLDFSGNLHPVTKSGDQLTNKFLAFRENRLPFTVRVKDPNNDPVGRISFYKEGRQGKGEAAPNPICNLNIALPADVSPEHTYTDKDILAIQAKYSFLREAGYGKFNTIQKADLRISDISNLLGKDWVKVARELDIEDQDINLIITEYPDTVGQQAMVMLRLWLNTAGDRATGNALKQALSACDRQDIIDQCTVQLQEVTDQEEMHRAESQLVQEDGFHSFKAGLNGFGGKSSALKRDYSMDASYDEYEMNQDREKLELISEDQETKYLAEEKTVESSTIIQESASSSQQSSFVKMESVIVEESSQRLQESSTTESMSFSHKQRAEVQQKESYSHQRSEELEQRLEKMSLEVTSLQTSETRSEEVREQTMVQESTYHKESLMEECQIQESTVHKESRTEASRMEESKIEEIRMEEGRVEETVVLESMLQQTKLDGSSTVGSIVEGSSMVQETKNGVVTKSENEEFSKTVTGTETLLDEAGDLVTEDREDKEEAAKKGGVKGLKAALMEDRAVESEIVLTGMELRAHTSSSDSDEGSEPESPKSPSPKVSPGSPKLSLHSSSRSSSDAALSNKSSQDDLNELRETERELLDEMIVKDVPISCTDPVRQFENSQTGINEPIHEDAEDTQCKDLINDTVTCTSLSKSSFNPNSSSPILSSDLNEMPSKDGDETSPTSRGLAAPDSKDSLEVQLYSVCDDISENLSGKEESLEDLKSRVDRHYSSQSEDDKISNVDEPVVEQNDYDDEQCRGDVEIIGEINDIETKEADAVFAELNKKGESNEAQDNNEVHSQGEDSFEIIESAEAEVEKVDEVSSVYKDEEYDCGLAVRDEDTIQREVQVQNEELKEVVKEKRETLVMEIKEELIVPEVNIKATNLPAEIQDETDKGDKNITKMKDVMEIFEKIESGADSQEDIVKHDHPFKKTVEHIAEQVSLDDECVSVTAYTTGSHLTRGRSSSSSSSSSSSEEGPRLVTQESTDSGSLYNVPVPVSPHMQAESPVPTQGLEESLVPTQGLEEYPVPSKGLEESPVPTQGLEESPAPTQGQVESPVPPQGLEESPVPIEGQVESPVPPQGLTESPFSGKEELVSQVSTDSSISTRELTTIKTKSQEDEVTEKIEFESDDLKHDGSDSSDTEEEKLASSSDYDTSSAKPKKGKRPDSFVSDTSSDYDSLSNFDPKRPQSFVIDDEYDVITEEETAECKDSEKVEVKDSSAAEHINDSSSSESYGADEKKYIEVSSSELDGISSLVPPFSPHPFPPSSVASTVDLHAEESSVSVDVAQSSVIHSNTLEEIDPLTRDGSTPLTRSSDSNPSQAKHSSQEATTTTTESREPRPQ